MSNRSAIVEQTITNHITDLAAPITVTVWEHEAWIEEVPATAETRQGKLIGWLPANMCEDGVEVQFCPAVIDGTTRHMGEQDFIDYLEVVKMSMSLSIANIEVPAIERAQIVDDGIARFRGSYRLYVDVQLRATSATA